MISWDHFHWQRKKRKIDLSMTEQPCGFIEAWNYLVLTKVILLRFKVKTKNWVYSVFLWKKMQSNCYFHYKNIFPLKSVVSWHSPLSYWEVWEFSKIERLKVGGGDNLRLWGIVHHDCQSIFQKNSSKFFFPGYDDLLPFFAYYVVFED